MTAVPSSISMIVINLKTAKELGLKISDSIQLLGDDVIEQVRQPQAGAIRPVEGWLKYGTTPVWSRATAAAAYKSDV
jgi:hypothetical protein